MPETVIWSTVMAVHTLWLAARARGLGLGWISILDPAEVTRALDIPVHWILIGYLCLGYPRTDSDTPELQCAGWECRSAAGSGIIRR
jgi:5,6-dimethylbenzimidazole synthase